MMDGVPRGIRGKGKGKDGISVDFVVEAGEEGEARLCKDGMCGFGKNMKV